MKLERDETSAQGCDILSSLHKSILPSPIRITPCHGETLPQRVALLLILQINPDVGTWMKADTFIHQTLMKHPRICRCSRMRISPLLSRNGLFVAYPINAVSSSWLQHLPGRQIPNRHTTALISPPLFLHSKSMCVASATAWSERASSSSDSVGQ